MADNSSRAHLPDLGPRGEGWVALQGVLFLVVVASAVAGPQLAGPARLVAALVGVAAIAGGAILAVAGIFWLRRHLTAYPRPMPGAKLVEDGPFGLVRHPIYGGIVIAAIGWALATASALTLVAAVGLGLFFDLKSRREEAWLAGTFAGYVAYRQRTRRLIPWVY